MPQAFPSFFREGWEGKRQGNEVGNVRNPNILFDLSQDIHWTYKKNGHSRPLQLLFKITFSFSLLYPDPPINVTIVSFSWSFVALKWTSPFHGRAIDFADLYRVIARSSEGEVTVTTSQTHARVDGLKQLTNYSVNAQAWNGLGYGPFLVTGIPYRTPGK